MEVPQSQGIQNLQSVCNLFLISEERERLRNRHLQNICDIFPLIPDFQGFFIELFAPAGIAGNLHRSEKMHPELVVSGSFAIGTTPPFGIE